ncbi:unnamed protein product [Caenorhabditis brenneri]
MATCNSTLYWTFESHPIDTGHWVFIVACFFVTFFSGYCTRGISDIVATGFHITVFACLSLGIFCSLTFIDFHPQLILMEKQFKECHPSWDKIPIAAVIQVTTIILMTLAEVYVVKKSIINEKRTSRKINYEDTRGIFLLLISHMIHGFAMGIPVGIPNNRFLTTSGNVLFHKWMESVTIGESLLGLDTKFIVFYLTVYSSMTPLGCYLGAYITLLDKSFETELWMVVLFALSTGVLFYITFIELLPHVMLADDVSIKGKLYSLIVPFICIAGMNISADVAFFVVQPPEPETMRPGFVYSD